MRIIDKINEAVAQDKIFYSFEYFPPKTEAGVENLYDRIERMAQHKPMFIDITWGAGGSTANTTIDIATTAQNSIGVETQIHMTCTNMRKTEIEAAIQKARDNGIQNILALRGDPPKGTEQWEATEGGFSIAKDLVQHIRKLHGNYFGIAVAGYPEGHPNGSYEEDLKYLKEKVDAGADFVITQLFYDCDKFLKFVQDCRKIGITCPILPGIMPIHNYQSWKRMTDFCKTSIPEYIHKDFEKVKLEDEEEVKNYGIKLCIQMCKYLMNNGVRGIHFYTLNLEKSVVKILEGLDMLQESIQRDLPWRVTANAKREKESVRPIFWSNRPKSYIARTSSWDEFPNGRWGNSRSPAFGELNDYHIIGLYAIGTKEERLKIWGEEHQNLDSIHQVFVNYLQGKTPKLPWFDKPIEFETSLIQQQLIQLNKNGFLTINSQPKVNALPSNDKQLGWGPQYGYVYQKAYIEFFCSPEQFVQLKKNMEKNPFLTYYAANMKGESYSSEPANSSTSANAVTWGVFPGKEILQPTVVDRDSFTAWKEEAFALWISQWASIYDQPSNAKTLINSIHDNYFLVSIVDNDYVNGDIFSVFNGLLTEVPESTTK